MIAPHDLHIGDGGDHSLAVTKRQLKANNETQEDVHERILRTIQNFVLRHLKVA